MAKPIFLLSNFRTGSTLLRYALDAHPEICCPAELRIAALCHHLFVASELLFAEDDVDSDGVRRRKAIALARHLVDTMMGVYCDRKQKPRWCEKSPANVELLNVISAVFPDASFICLHRNPWDQVHSTLDYEGALRLQRYIARRNGDLPASALDRWCSVTERLLAFEHAHQGQTVRVLYEAFTSDPEAELYRIMRSIDVTVVDGLSVSAFRTNHDRGPQDAKISRTRQVERDRVDKPRSIDIGRMPPALASRTEHLLRSLGYGC